MVHIIKELLVKNNIETPQNVAKQGWEKKFIESSLTR